MLDTARLVPRHVPDICARRTGATGRTRTHIAPTLAQLTLSSTYGAVSQAWLMECFLLVFACSLLQDCVRFPSTMGPLLLAHHAACLVGMLVARFAPGSEWGSVFPWFFGGCTALEFGSGFNNIFWLRWLPPRQSALLYLSTMTASNLVAVGCACAWVRTAGLETWCGMWYAGRAPSLAGWAPSYAGRHVRAFLHLSGSPALVELRDASLLPRRDICARLPPTKGDAEAVRGDHTALAWTSRALRLNV